MNQETAKYIMQRMSKYLDNSQMIKLKDTLDDVEKKEFLRELVEAMYEELPTPEKKFFLLLRRNIAKELAMLHGVR